MAQRGMASDPTIRAQCVTIREYLAGEHRMFVLAFKALPVAVISFLVCMFFESSALFFFAFLLVFLVATAILFYAGGRYLYYNYRLINHQVLICPECKSENSTGRTWVCGFCNTTHIKSYFRWAPSYFEKCKKCGRTPPAVICRVCREPVMFGDGDPKASAWFPDYPPRTPKKSVPTPPRHIDDDLR